MNGLKYKLKAFWFGASAPDVAFLNGAAFSLGVLGLVVTVWAAPKAGALIGLALAAIGFGFFAYSVRDGMRLFKQMGEKKVQALASRWVREGADADEVRRRHAMLMDMGPAAALTTAGVAFDWLPSHNADGIPMVAGTGTDIYGRSYGDITRDPYTFDSANGMVLTPDLEYHSPMGMDGTSGGAPAGGSGGLFDDNSGTGMR